MDKYNLDTSIRLYIREFEAQARHVGIEDFNILINYISKYMPPLIRQWIPTQDASKRTNWKKLKYLLIDQFGLSLEDEQKDLIAKLKSLKQNRNEPTCIYSAKWVNTLYAIPFPNLKVPASQQVPLFIQFLYSKSLRATFSLVRRYQRDKGSQSCNQKSNQS
jgi:hypothetical protein